MVEEDPNKIPEPLGRALYVGCFVDAEHCGNVITRRLYSGTLLSVNNALFKSSRMRQNTVQSSTFGSEIVALRIARDMIVDIRIKFKCFEVPLARPENVCCDNNEVVKNTSISESTLSKKHNAINYHCMRDAAAAGILRVWKEDTAKDLADPLMKLPP